MSRLIDADYQDKNLKYWLDTNTENGVTWIPSNILERVLGQPTADAEPVIRCKDCKHFKTYEFGNRCNRNMPYAGTMPVNPDDFCSYGEKIDEVKENE